MNTLIEKYPSMPVEISQCLTQHHAIAKLVSDSIQDVQKQLLEVARETSEIKATLTRFEQFERRSEKSMDELNRSFSEIKNGFKDSFDRVHMRIDKQQEEIDEVKHRMDTDKKVTQARLNTLRIIWGVIVAIGGILAWIIQKALPFLDK